MNKYYNINNTGDNDRLTVHYLTYYTVTCQINIKHRFKFKLN